MAVTTTALLLGSLAVSAAGVGAQIYGQSKQTQAMRAAEAARQQQANLEALRRQREIIRNGIIARQTAVWNAAGQGGLFGSGLQGGFAQISGQTGTQSSATEQNRQLGSDVFAANQRYYNASSITSLGTGLQSLGGTVLTNIGTIERIGTNAGFITV